MSIDELLLYGVIFAIGIVIGVAFGYFSQKASEARAERIGFMHAWDKAERSKSDEIRSLLSAHSNEREVWKMRVSDLKEILNKPLPKSTDKPPPKKAKR